MSQTNSEPIVQAAGSAELIQIGPMPSAGHEPTRSARTWSATRLKTYLTCPRQYRYAYIDGIPSIPTAPLVFGHTIHETLCHVQEYQMRARRLPKLPDVLLHFHGLWGRAMMQERPYFSDSAPSSRQYRQVARDILRTYLEDPANAAVPLAVELAFEVRVGDGANPCRLTGIVDRVEQGDDGLVVVDFKSGRRRPKATEVQEDLQFVIYALAIERMFGQTVERVCYSHLRDGSCIDVYPQAAEFERLEGEILPMVSGAVERGEFAAAPGYWCNWCDFRELCSAENGLRWKSRLAGDRVAGNHALEDRPGREGA